jgi:hypothetical protein
LRIVGELGLQHLDRDANHAMLGGIHRDHTAALANVRSHSCECAAQARPRTMHDFHAALFSQSPFTCNQLCCP